jgi:hypothetical protein
MRTAFIFLLLAILALAFFYWHADVFLTAETIDFHLHDTYVVVDWQSAIILLTLSIGTIFFLGGLLGTGFRSRGFRAGFLLFLVADIGLVLYVYYLLSS